MLASPRHSTAVDADPSALTTASIGELGQRTRRMCSSVSVAAGRWPSLVQVPGYYPEERERADARRLRLIAVASSCRVAGAPLPLLRQLHLAQECLVARVSLEVFEQGITLYKFESGIALSIGAVKPSEG